MMERLPESGPDRECKLLSLEQAIRRHVRPQMSLHLAGGIGGPGAAICELIRQFFGRAPGFTVVQSTVTGHALNLVQSGLVEKLVCAVCAEISGSARPSRVVQQACKNKTIELENWSLLSLQQRLMAGAFGFPFMPTRSVSGTGLADDNAKSFSTLDDPFGSGTKIGVVKALNPDLSIVHGCIGDAQGNTVLALPNGEDLWGAFASREGVLVTVEKIVPSEVLKRYSGLVKIPAYLVRSISEVPLGLHPYSFPNPGIDDFDSYEKDIEFLDGFGAASKRSDLLDEWIKAWVLDCPSPRAYLDKLGQARIAALKTPPRAAQTRVYPSPPAPRDAKEAPTEEMMLVAVAREIVRSVRKSGHKTILAGAGLGATAAFLAYSQLREEGIEIDLVTGNGQVGYTPIPGESILASDAGLRSSKMLADTVMTQGVLVGGANNKCLSVLGAGQIDAFGNINSSRTAAGEFLVGSGGANDALNAREVIVALKQSTDRFVEKLAYVTGRGHNVTTVVSTMGVFRKPDATQALQLVGCFQNLKSADRAAQIEEIRGECGWPLQSGPDVEAIPAPSREEIDLLRWLQARPGDTAGRAS